MVILRGLSCSTEDILRRRRSRRLAGGGAERNHRLISPVPSGQIALQMRIFTTARSVWKR